EFGKTCARSPAKADEIVAGTLNTLSQDGRIIIESTGEGTEGYFADMVTAAAARGNEDLTPLDYKLFFFPWYTEPSYKLSQPVTYDVTLGDYFAKIEGSSAVTLSTQQRAWYARQLGVLQDKMRQEFPSTISEAFLSSSEAYYYAAGIAQAYDDGRMLHTDPYDPLLPVYVAMDIGVRDCTVMIYYQCCHGEVRVIDYYENAGPGVEHYANHLMTSSRYVYHTIFLPHDAVKRDGCVVDNVYEREFRRLVAHSGTLVKVLPKTDRMAGIIGAKVTLGRTVFAINKVKPLVDHMSKYRRKWSEQTGRYLDEPLHDVHSNAADAYRYLSQSLPTIDLAGSSINAMERHRAAVESRARRL
ncbi:MAG: hypothetical protein Q8O94_03465, partial [bacterium]|nr:hypothetical protein [bacterium]